jgi:hypothetical protein
MSRPDSWLVIWVLLSLIGAPSAQGQLVQDSVRLQQVTAAASEIVHWTFDEGIGQQTIYLKNTSRDRTVTITGWRVFDCDNLKRRSCGEHSPGPTLQPGKTVRLTTVERQDEERAYSFRYDFTASYPEDPAPVLALADPGSRSAPDSILGASPEPDSIPGARSEPDSILHERAVVRVQAPRVASGWLPGTVARSRTSPSCLAVKLERNDAAGRRLYVFLEAVTALEVDERTNQGVWTIDLPPAEPSDWRALTREDLAQVRRGCRRKTY